MEVFAGVGENAVVCRDPDCRSPLTPKLISIYHRAEQNCCVGVCMSCRLRETGPTIINSSRM